MGAVLSAIAIWFATLPRDPIDRCLDHGGCWDDTDDICRLEEPDAQALCDR